MRTNQTCRPLAQLGKPSQLCQRFGFPADGQASDFGFAFDVDTTPFFLLFIGGSASPLAPAAGIYALLMDANDQAIALAPGRRAKFSIGPIPPGGTFVFSEPVTEWWGLTGTDGGMLEGRPAFAGMPFDNGLIVVASTTPLIVTAPLLANPLSIYARGQK